MKKLPILACCALLAACSTDSDHEDLRQWMSESSTNLKGKVPPLPQVRPYEPIAYDAGNLVDPFKSTRVIPEKVSGGGGGVKPPDETRVREPLESYPLESLRYVGVLTRKNESYAIIQVDSSLFQVRPGNYLGQNFGVITKVTESEVVLKELVQNAMGEWGERMSSLLLQGQEVIK
jgi:type IV pilus assembly protein PilP